MEAITKRAAITTTHVSFPFRKPQKPFPYESEARQISTCFQKLLAPYFQAAGEFRGIDLKEIKIYQGVPSIVKNNAVITVAAVTIGNSIYFNPNNYGEFTLDDLEQMAHELTHVKQYRLHGMIGFVVDYLSAYRHNRKRGMEPQDAERNNPLEREAEKEASAIRKAVGAIHGEYPCNDVGREP